MIRKNKMRVKVLCPTGMSESGDSQSREPAGIDRGTWTVSGYLLLHNTEYH